jgi:hypothetical protein
MDAKVLRTDGNGYGGYAMMHENQENGGRWATLMPLI